MMEEYYPKDLVFYTPHLRARLKLWLFGKRFEERSGPYKAVWYQYKGKIYLAEYRRI